MNRPNLLAALLLTGSANAFAVPMAFTTEASWIAALGAATIATENFESTALGSLTAPGTTDVGLFNVSLNAVGDAGTNTVTAGSATGMSGRHLRLDLDLDNNTQVNFSNFDLPGVFGFAGTWASTISGNKLTMTVNGTTLKFSDYLTGAGNGFFGIVDTTMFSSIELGTEGLNSFGEDFRVDNVKLASSVPEPATIALMGLGLLGVGVSRGRKQN